MFYLILINFCLYIILFYLSTREAMESFSKIRFFDWKKRNFGRNLISTVNLFSIQELRCPSIIYARLFYVHWSILYFFVLYDVVYCKLIFIFVYPILSLLSNYFIGSKFHWDNNCLLSFIKIWFSIKRKSSQNIQVLLNVCFISENK